MPSKSIVKSGYCGLSYYALVLHSKVSAVLCTANTLTRTTLMGRLLTTGSRWVEQWPAEGMRAHSWPETHIDSSSAGNIHEKLRRRTEAAEGKVSLGWDRGYWDRI